MNPSLLGVQGDDDVPVRLKFSPVRVSLVCSSHSKILIGSEALSTDSLLSPSSPSLLSVRLSPSLMLIVEASWHFFLSLWWWRFIYFFIVFCSLFAADCQQRDSSGICTG